MSGSTTSLPAVPSSDPASSSATRDTILAEVEAAFLEGLAGAPMAPRLLEEVRHYYEIRFDRRPEEVLSLWGERRAKVLQKVRLIAKRAVRESRRRQAAVGASGIGTARQQLGPTVWCGLDTH